MLKYVFFACESHCNAIATTVLGVLSGELDDLRIEETRKIIGKMLYTYLRAAEYDEYKKKS